jgi:hypothetical protein
VGLLTRRRGWLAAGAALASLVGVGALDLLLWDSLRPRATPTPPLTPGLQGRSAAECAACHPEQAAEWRSSRMGGSWSAASFQVDWAKNGALPFCLGCHAPLLAQQDTLVSGVWWPLPLRLLSRPNPDFDATLQAEGVTCVACHALDDGTIATGRQVGAPHATRVDPTLATRCARCHQSPAVALHPLARPMFDTVAEHERWQAATGSVARCVDCHMPAVARASGQTGRSHTFRGGWDPQMLARAVSISPATRAGDDWSVVVTNTSGHHFPTGETTGGAVVRLIGLGAGGEVVATEEVWLARRIVGPPFLDVGDSTLAGGEARVIRVALPAAVQTVQAEVRLRRYAFAEHLRRVADPAALDVPIAASAAW